MTEKKRDGVKSSKGIDRWTERAWEGLQRTANIPWYVFIILSLGAFIFAAATVSLQSDLNEYRAVDAYAQDVAEDSLTSSVASQGLAFTWDWFASHMLMWLYHGRVVFAFVLALVLLIHGFKVVGR